MSGYPTGDWNMQILERERLIKELHQFIVKSFKAMTDAHPGMIILVDPTAEGPNCKNCGACMCANCHNHDHDDDEDHDDHEHHKDASTKPGQKRHKKSDDREKRKSNAEKDVVVPQIPPRPCSPPPYFQPRPYDLLTQMTVDFQRGVGQRMEVIEKYPPRSESEPPIIGGTFSFAWKTGNK